MRDLLHERNEDEGGKTRNNGLVREAVFPAFSKTKGRSVYCLITSVPHAPAISLERLLKDNGLEDPLGNKGWRLHSLPILIWSLHFPHVKMTWEETWIYRKAGRRKLESASTFSKSFLSSFLSSCRGAAFSYLFFIISSLLLIILGNCVNNETPRSSQGS